MSKMVRDGYDLGILIRLRQWGRLGFSRVMGELISEVGWLKGGKDELVERLDGLIEQGLIERVDDGFADTPRLAHYEITEKGMNKENWI